MGIQATPFATVMNDMRAGKMPIAEIRELQLAAKQAEERCIANEAENARRLAVGTRCAALVRHAIYHQIDVTTVPCIESQRTLLEWCGWLPGREDNYWLRNTDPSRQCSTAAAVDYVITNMSLGFGADGYKAAHALILAGWLPCKNSQTEWCDGLSVALELDQAFLTLMLQRCTDVTRIEEHVTPEVLDSVIASIHIPVTLESWRGEIYKQLGLVATPDFKEVVAVYAPECFDPVLCIQLVSEFQRKHVLATAYSPDTVVGRNIEYLMSYAKQVYNGFHNIATDAVKARLCTASGFVECDGLGNWQAPNKAGYRMTLNEAHLGVMIDLLYELPSHARDAYTLLFNNGWTVNMLNWTVSKGDMMPVSVDLGVLALLVEQTYARKVHWSNLRPEALHNLMRWVRNEGSHANRQQWVRKASDFAEALEPLANDLPKQSYARARPTALGGFMYPKGHGFPRIVYNSDLAKHKHTEHRIKLEGSGVEIIVRDMAALDYKPADPAIGLAAIYNWIAANPELAAQLLNSTPKHVCPCDPCGRCHCK